MTIYQMRTLLDLSAQKFGDKYNIPMRTIQNWESGTSVPPAYVLELLERSVVEDYEEENGHIYQYSIESTEYDANYDLHLGHSDDLDEAKKIAKRFSSDFPVVLCKTVDFLTGSYDPIEF